MVPGLVRFITNLGIRIGFSLNLRSGSAASYPSPDNPNQLHPKLEDPDPLHPILEDPDPIHPILEDPDPLHPILL